MTDANSSELGFDGYVVATKDPGVALYVFVLAYMALSFLLVAPLVIWGANYDREKRRQATVEKNSETLSPTDGAPPPGEYNQGEASVPAVNVTISPDNNTISYPPQQQQQQQQQRIFPDNEKGNVVATTSLSTSQDVTTLAQERVVVETTSAIHRGGSERVSPSISPEVDTTEPIVATTASSARTVLSYMGRSSAALSAATTSKLRAIQRSSRHTGEHPSHQHQPSSSLNHPTRLHGGGVWDVGGRRWKDRRPIGRADMILRAIASEANTRSSTTIVPDNRPSVTTRGINPHTAVTPRAGGGHHHHHHNNMSDLASSILDEHTSEGEMSVYSRGFVRKRRANSRQSGRSMSTTSDKSVLPPLNPDLISPNDAADANDPGRGDTFERIDVTRTVFYGPRALWRARTISEAWDGLLEIAAPNFETRRIVSLAIPLTLGAITEPLCRVIITAFVAHKLGTDSMVAFVLVFILLRLTTEELAGAVVDAESALVYNTLCSGQESSLFVAGQYVQLSLLLQLLMTVPIFIIWYFYMDNVVDWLVASASISCLAKHYTRVVLYRFLIQIVARPFAVVSHESGSENFDSTVGVCENIVTLVLVACVVSLVSDVNLNTVGCIQVIVGGGSAVTKIAWSLYKGWLQPYCRGISTNVAITNHAATRNIVLTSFPLLVGTFLEFGEFEMLAVATRYLGPAEVATFAMLTLVWEVFEASTDGIGEAASVRVAYHLGEGHSATAHMSSKKVLFLSIVLSLVATSLLYIAGANLAVALTNDDTLQHLLNSGFTFLGLATINLTFARVCWSLIGAQGRFRVATMVMLLSRWLVTLPVAFICIFGLFLDLNAVIAAVTVGYATTCCALAYLLFRSNWDQLVQSIQELSAALLVSEDFDDSCDDSDNSAVRVASGEL